MVSGAPLFRIAGDDHFRRWGHTILADNELIDQTSFVCQKESWHLGSMEAASIRTVNWAAVELPGAGICGEIQCQRR